MLELLIIVILAGHLLAMNLASAGPLVSVWLRWHGNEWNNSLGRRLAWWSVSALVIGMVTGGLLIVTTPGTGLWNSLGRLPASAYWFAAAVLMFSFVCLVAIAGGSLLCGVVILMTLSLRLARPAAPVPEAGTKTASGGAAQG